MRCVTVKNIVCDPGTLGGKPVLEGTRLSVAHILGLLANGMTSEEIATAYPEVTEQDLRTVLSYASEALHNDVVLEVHSAQGS